MIVADLTHAQRQGQHARQGEHPLPRRSRRAQQRRRYEGDARDAAPARHQHVAADRVDRRGVAQLADRRDDRRQPVDRSGHVRVHHLVVDARSPCRRSRPTRTPRRSASRSRRATCARARPPRSRRRRAVTTPARPCSTPSGGIPDADLRRMSSSYFTALCRTVFTTTTRARKPAMHFLQQTEATTLGPLMASNLTPRNQEVLIQRVLAGDDSLLADASSARRSAASIARPSRSSTPARSSTRRARDGVLRCRRRHAPRGVHERRRSVRHHRSRAVGVHAAHEALDGALQHRAASTARRT